MAHSSFIEGSLTTKNMATVYTSCLSLPFFVAIDSAHSLESHGTHVSLSVHRNVFRASGLTGSGQPPTSWSRTRSESPRYLNLLPWSNLARIGNSRGHLLPCVV